MEKTIKVCDVANCRSLADVACAVCKSDLCAPHGQFQIRVGLMLVSPRDTSAPRLPVEGDLEMAVGDDRPICRECVRFMHRSRRHVIDSILLPRITEAGVIEQISAFYVAESLRTIRGGD